MLDQLVESKSHAGEDSRRGGLLLTTLVVLVAVLFGGWVYSLFAKDYGVLDDGLSLQTLVAPPVIEEAPEPEPEKQPEQQQKQKDPNVDVRKEIVQNIFENPVKPPEKPSVVKPTVPPRRLDVLTVVGSTNRNASNPLPDTYTGRVNKEGTGSDSGKPGQGGKDETRTTSTAPPPPVKKPPSKPISGGVLNGKARNLPKPAYPPAARAIRASGAVNVQVLIDENGNVVSANAVSGHPLLRAAAVGAARQAKFSPTLLSGQPVKVSGVITYNFQAP